MNRFQLQARKKEEREKENEDRRRKQKEQDRAEEEEHRSAGRVLRLGIHGFPARKGNNHTVMMIAEIHLDTEQRVNGVEWIYVGKKEFGSDKRLKGVYLKICTSEGEGASSRRDA